MSSSMPASPLPSASISIAETQEMVLIHELAHATWPTAYQGILAQDQLEYMLETVYEVPSLEKQAAEGQVFLLLRENGIPVAFASYAWLYPAESVCKLNKLYIHPEHQGKGYGARLLAEVAKRCRAWGARWLELNVHRQNPAYYFYLKQGFTVYQTVDLPFGPYTLTDYLMRLPLS